MSSFPAPSPEPTTSSDESQRLTPAVRAIIAINVAVMFVQMTVLFKDPYPSLLAFDANGLPGRWYTAFTYLFAHAGVWHLLANMYGLFLFGPRVERSMGTKKFTWFYLLCGLGGVVFQMLFIRSRHADRLVRRRVRRDDRVRHAVAGRRDLSDVRPADARPHARRRTARVQPGDGHRRDGPDGRR